MFSTTRLVSGETRRVAGESRALPRAETACPLPRNHIATAALMSRETRTTPAGREPIVYVDIAALNPSAFCEALPKSRQALLGFQIVPSQRRSTCRCAACARRLAERAPRAATQLRRRQAA